MNPSTKLTAQIEQKKEIHANPDLNIHRQGVAHIHEATKFRYTKWQGGLENLLIFMRCIIETALYRKL